MKKMSVFATLALLVLGLAGVAQAAEIKATGKWQIESQWNNDLDFFNDGANNSPKSFHIEQRMRTKFEFIASENLKGVLDTQIGSQAWGAGMYSVGSGRTPNTTATGANGAGNGNIMLRQGYIDFKWPGTKVNFKAGFQTVSLPAAFGGGSPILDDQVGAVVVSTPITDNVSLLAGYARPSDVNTFGSTSNGVSAGSIDVVFAAAPISFTGFNIAPYAAFMYGGSGSTAANLVGLNSVNSVTAGTGARGYWGGAAFTMTALDPFKVMADFHYGKVTYNNNIKNTEGGRSGWMADLAVDYTGLSMMTPEVFFVYSSGEDGQNKDSSSRMPTLGNPQSWNVNNSLFFADRNFISGTSTVSTGGSYGGGARGPMGFWTAGVSLKDIKVFDKFSHTFNLLYARGTNDPNYLLNASNQIATAGYGVFMTTEDSLWEVDLNNKYNIYEGLDLLLDLSYINADFNKTYWSKVNAKYGTDQATNDSAYRVALGLSYAF